MYRNRSLLIVLALFAAIYCSISLVNHYLFRTYAHDMGIVNNAIYDYAHLRWNDCMLIDPPFRNLLEDHFTLLQILFAPLSYLFGSYTMLIVQIAAILAGGMGVYRYFLEKNDRTFALLAAIHFYSAFGIFSALGFDFHDNVIGAMAVPWLFYFFRKEQWLPCSLMVLFVVASKENMALWMGFIGIGLLLDNLRVPAKRIAAGLFALFAFGWFYVVINYVMPSLAIVPRGYLHFQYDVLGKSFGDAMSFFVHHPFQSVKLLFINHLPNPEYNGVKAELHFMVLVSGGIFLLLRPAWIVMLLPIYAQKMYCNDVIKWGISCHYSIEFAPILTLVAFSVLAGIANPGYRKWAAIIACAFSLYFSIHKIDSRTAPFYDGYRHRFYAAEHYRNNIINVKETHRVIHELIPPDAPLSAHQVLVPHLAFRQKIYLYPDINDAQYIVLLNKQGPYPMSQTEWDAAMIKLKADSTWEKLYDKENLLLFKRKQQ